MKKWRVPRGTMAKHLEAQDMTSRMGVVMKILYRLYRYLVLLYYFQLQLIACYF